MTLAAGLLLFLVAAGDAPQAEAAYRSGKYAIALEQFRAEEAASPAPQPRVLYNIGNCCFRLGRFAEAAVAYKRCLRRSPSDPQARFNLQLSLSKLGVPPPPPETFFASAQRAVDETSPAALLAGAALAECAGLVLLFAGRRRRPLLWLGGMILIGSAAGGAAYVHRVAAAPQAEGLVIAADARLRAEPRDDLPTTLTLKAGEPVIVEERSDRWVRVRYGDRTGWTDRASIGLVD